MNPPDSNQSAEAAALKNQVFTLLVALIVVTGTFTVYLYRQVSMANKGIQQGTAIETQLRGGENAINNFVGHLAGYAEKHPDFAPILRKYITLPPPGAMPAPPAATAPAAPKK